MLKAIMIILKKELKDIWRDKRTLLVSIALPLILFPLLFWFLGQGFTERFIKKALPITISYNAEDPQLKSFLNNQDYLLVIKHPKPIKAVRQGLSQLALISKQSAEYREGLILYFDNLYPPSKAAKTVIEKQLKDYFRRSDSGQSKSTGFQAKTVNDPATEAGTSLLLTLLPALLLIYSAICPLPFAADLAAGEKERNTLEPLLCSPCPRPALLIGKWLAATIMGGLGIAAFLSGFIMSYLLNPRLLGTSDPIVFALNPWDIAFIGWLALTAVMLFSALELTISFYARSAKEAQSYSLPIMILGLAASYGSELADLKFIDWHFVSIPLLNIHLMIKSIIIERFNGLNFSLTLFVNILAICLILFIAHRLLRKEQVLLRS